MTLDDYLRVRREEVEAALDELVPKGDVRPSTIHQAMRHSLFAGGKRIRPVLFLAAAEAVGGPVARASGNPTDAREQDDT